MSKRASGLVSKHGKLKVPQEHRLVSVLVTDIREGHREKRMWARMQVPAMFCQGGVLINWKLDDVAGGKVKGIVADVLEGTLNIVFIFVNKREIEDLQKINPVVNPGTDMQGRDLGFDHLIARFKSFEPRLVDTWAEVEGK